MIIIDLFDAIKELQRDELNCQFFPGGFYAVIRECVYYLADPFSVAYEREIANHRSVRQFNHEVEYYFGDHLVRIIEDEQVDITREDILNAYNVGVIVEARLRDFIPDTVVNACKNRIREVVQDKRDTNVFVIRLRD